MKLKLFFLVVLALSLLPLIGPKPNPAVLRTSLLSAVRSNNTQEAIALIHKGADANSRTSATGWSVLHYAVRNGNVELVQSLLSAGADANYAGAMEGQTGSILSEKPLSIAQAALDLVDQVPSSRIEGTLHQAGLDTDTALVSSMKDVNATQRYQKVVELLAPVTKGVVSAPLPAFTVRPQPQRRLLAVGVEAV
jgi:hypothetical protein